VGEVQLVMVVSAVAFLLGSLPFAVWLGWIFSGRDVRAVGDGNPGTANAFKAAGWRTGVPVLVLEVGKAGVPVGLANWVFGLGPWGLVPVALAPVLGHSFSPFLRFRGGKAIAATFGSWAGLTGVLGPAALALSLGAGFALQKVDAWTVVGGLLLFGIVLLVVGAPLALVAIWSFELALLGWKHRGEFSRRFSPRAWVPLFKDRRG
jgi:glycerol-3-phosphate acyltransferase PlsY